MKGRYNISRVIILFSIMIMLSASGCLADHKYKYDYSKLVNVSKQLKEVYLDMKASMNDIYDNNKFESARLKILSDLEDVGYEIDELPEAEKEPENKNDTEAQIFNKKLFNARDLKNKIIDIYDLLHDATVCKDVTYYKSVMADEAMEARLDNIIVRAEEKGAYVPLDEEYINLTIPTTHEGAEITIDEESDNEE